MSLLSPYLHINHGTGRTALTCGGELNGRLSLPPKTVGQASQFWIRIAPRLWNSINTVYVTASELQPVCSNVTGETWLTVSSWVSYATESFFTYVGNVRIGVYGSFCHGDNCNCCPNKSFYCCDNWNCHRNNPGLLRLCQQNGLLRQERHFLREFERWVFHLCVPFCTVMSIRDEPNKI